MTAVDGPGVHRAATSKLTNTGARCAGSSKSRQSPEIALIGLMNNSMSFFLSLSLSLLQKRTAGAIDESVCIFNGSESLGQAGGPRDDGLRGESNEEEETEEGRLRSEGQTLMRRHGVHKRLDLPRTSTSKPPPLASQHLTGQIASPGFRVQREC